MKKIAISEHVHFLCLKSAIENYCSPDIFFENLADLLENNEKIIQVKGTDLITNRCRIIELNEII